MTSVFPADQLSPVTRTDLRPAYAQIAGQIRRVIIEQKLTVGTQLPVEAELVERFGVSRMTVREGLRLLRSEGVLRAEQGVGVFVDVGVELPSVFLGVPAPNPESEPGWREAVARLLKGSPQVGPVHELEEIWASNAVGVPVAEISRIDVNVSEHRGWHDKTRLYVAASAESATTVAAAAIEDAARWEVSVRGAGPGDVGRGRGDLVVARTALDVGGEILLAAQSFRSGNWAVTVIDSLG